MIRKEELLKNPKLEGMTEEQVNEIVSITQTIGDSMKQKSQLREQELLKSISSIDNSESIVDTVKDVITSLKTEMTNEISTIKEQVSTIVESAESTKMENALMTKRSNLLREAKEKGYDIVKFEAYLKHAGENLPENVEELNDIFGEPKADEGTADVDEGNIPEPTNEIITGDDIIDSLIN